jgi:hypothetical protein
MPTRVRSLKFSAVVTIIVMLIVAVVGGVWYVWHKNGGNDAIEQTADTETSKKAPAETTQQNQTNPPADPSEESKYLTIKEWGVRVALPEGMDGAVIYRMGETFSDPDGNQIQAAKIMMTTSALPENECSTFSTSDGEASETGAQYIRSESAKQFDAERYRWTFKENILRTNGYNYHLNYVTPDCIGAAVDKVEVLQAALINLRQVE